MQPIIAHKGMNRFRCTVRGREAHSSYVTHGVNAIEYAARLVVYIRQIADRLAQFEQRDCGFTVPYTTLSTGLIRGGIAANVMPKECEFQFDMRTLPNASADALYQEIRAHAELLAREMRAIDPQAGIDLEWASQTVGPRGGRERCDRAMGDAARAQQLDRQGVLRHRGGPVSADGRAHGDLGARRHRRGASAERVRRARAARAMRDVHEPHSRDGLCRHEASGRGELPATRIVKGACPHDCPDTCALEVHVKDGVALKVTGSAAHGPTAGVLCTKVARYTERTYHPDRLLHPLRRIGRKGEGRFERISWDEAIATVAERLAAHRGGGSAADPSLQLRRHDGTWCRASRCRSGSSTGSARAFWIAPSAHPPEPPATRSRSGREHRHRRGGGGAGEAHHFLGLQRHHLERAFLGARAGGEAPRRDAHRHRSLSLAHGREMPRAHRPAAGHRRRARARTHARAHPRRSDRSRLRRAPYAGLRCSLCERVRGYDPARVAAICGITGRRDRVARAPLRARPGPR